MAESRADTGERFTDEDVDRATAAASAYVTPDGYGEGTAAMRGENAERCARAVLSSIEAVPEATCEKHTPTVSSHLRCPYCHIEQAVARAESAEARCESYRAALIEIAGYRYPAPNQQAKIARAALEDGADSKTSGGVSPVQVRGTVERESADRRRKSTVEPLPESAALEDTDPKEQTR